MMDDRKMVLWSSLLLTVLIFSIGMLLNHVFDVFRISTIVEVMRAHEVDSEAYRAERFFTETFGGEQCEVMTARISDLKREIRKVGDDLGSYSRFSFFRRTDYDYLKRKYFLLELRFLALIERLNRECGKPYLPIIFFYEIDDDASERQGFILEELSEEYDPHLVVLSLDKNYHDEPLVEVLAASYNISSAPTIVIAGQVFEGLRYGGELNASVQRFLRRPDPFAQHVDFMFTPRAAGANVSRLAYVLEGIAANESADFWARGDAALVLGRMTGNESLICGSLMFFDRVNASSHEEAALLYETSAALGCGRNRGAFLRAAAGEWRSAGNFFRADLLERIALGARVNLAFGAAAVNANRTVYGYVSPIVPQLPETDSESGTVGNTVIRVDRSDVVVSQDDRVFRDWLGGQLQDPYGPLILTTFSERLEYPPSELLAEDGWHEGAIVKRLRNVDASHVPAVGALVAARDGRWFAVDDRGVFRFEVPKDKVFYPTTRFLRRDLAVIIDTHGVNMLVEPALRYNASVVVGCCDHPGKVYAAKYLSDRGVDVICSTDKYLYLALGHNLSALGSAPLSSSGGEVVVGLRPLNISGRDRIVAVNASDKVYALWYYQTPASYMAELAKALHLDVSYVTLDAFGQMSRATEKAREINATLLAARVFNSADYFAVKRWLDEDSSRRVILFHSASYPYGRRILDEYPSRSTFDDPNPVFVG